MQPMASHCTKFKCSPSSTHANRAATAGSMLIMMPKVSLGRRFNAIISNEIGMALDTAATAPRAPLPHEEGSPVTGAGSTHAWLQAYLPGAGWVAYDPTNNLMGSGQLIRVGVSRDPALAAPVAGSW